MLHQLIVFHQSSETHDHSRSSWRELHIGPGVVIAWSGSGRCRAMASDAPVRYPFLWNSFRQDLTQWAGFQKNGSDALALARNLGQAYGIFVAFHPRPTPGSAFKLNVDYVGEIPRTFPDYPRSRR